MKIIKTHQALCPLHIVDELPVFCHDAVELIGLSPDNFVSQTLTPCGADKIGNTTTKVLTMTHVTDGNAIVAIFHKE